VPEVAKLANLNTRRRQDNFRRALAQAAGSLTVTALKAVSYVDVDGLVELTAKHQGPA